MPVCSVKSVLSGNSHIYPDTMSEIDDSKYKVNQVNLRNRSQSNRKNLKIKNIHLKKHATVKKRRIKDRSNFYEFYFDYLYLY